MTAPKTKQATSASIAASNDLEVLRLIHRFGWLPTRHIAQLHWPNVSQHRSAQRTLARLLESGDVLCRQAPDGGRVYAIAGRGAARLNDEGIAAKSGKDLLRSMRLYKHRCVANQAVIDALAQGIEVYTEHEIQTGVAPFKSTKEKVADALLICTAPNLVGPYGTSYIWVEAEQSPKQDPAMRKLAAFICEVLGLKGVGEEVAPYDAGLDHYIVGVQVHVQSPGQISRLMGFIDAHLHKNKNRLSRQAVFENTVTVLNHKVTKPLAAYASS